MDTSRLDFKQWPLDLLVDYALKVHHRTIRHEGPKTLQLLNKLSVDNDTMREIAQLFAGSLDALDNHLAKEEQVLFPYLYELAEAQANNQNIQAMHCGTISNPIRVMMMEHSDELERHLQIEQLTDGYKVPTNTNAEEEEAIKRLKEFRDALVEHIHIENDIIFPGFEEIEQKVVNQSYSF